MVEKKENVFLLTDPEAVEDLFLSEEGPEVTASE